MSGAGGPGPADRPEAGPPAPGRARSGSPGPVVVALVPEAALLPDGATLREAPADPGPGANDPAPGPCPGTEALVALCRGLAAGLGGEVALAGLHRFPDGEAGVRLVHDLAGRDVVLAVHLHDPDPKLLPLAFLADLCRDLGARRVVLCAPYLPYMRQDARFRPGEAITSASFARVVSRYVDGLVTVDPHLHRHPTLDAIYAVPSRVVAAAPLLAAWIASRVPRPVVVGPDEESAQWARAVAEGAGAPWLVLTKVRRGDHAVEVSRPDLAGLAGLAAAPEARAGGQASAAGWGDRTPVLVDDIVSTAGTVVRTLERLRAEGARPAVVAAVHAVFAGDGWARLQAAGPAEVVTTTTIPHATNGIDVAPALAPALADLLAALGRA